MFWRSSASAEERNLVGGGDVLAGAELALHHSTARAGTYTLLRHVALRRWLPPLVADAHDGRE